MIRRTICRLHNATIAWNRFGVIDDPDDDFDDYRRRIQQERLTKTRMRENWANRQVAWTGIKKAAV